jgi:hypothetical protein
MSDVSDSRGKMHSVPSVASVVNASPMEGSKEKEEARRMREVGM